MALHSAAWVRGARVLIYCILALVVAASTGAVTTEPAYAATFTVNSTADRGDQNPGDGGCSTGVLVPGDGIANVPECTLRAAIQEANASAGADAIAFSIPSGDPNNCKANTGVCTISPVSTLPTIAEAVNINGYTQRPCSSHPEPCSKPNSSTVGTNAVLLIELDGRNIPPCDCGGVQINSSNSVVRGLVINRFSSGVYIFPNGTRNATGNRIVGNFIGTNPYGTLDRGNHFDGVAALGDSNTVGGTSDAARNLISGNGQDGIHARGTGVRVLGNLIGTDRTGTEALGNDFYGVNIDEVSFSIISRDLVANANVIAFNGRAGVGISAGSKGISILRNSIFSNRGLGIDLGGNGRTPNDAGDTDTGPNNLQNFPLVTSAVTRGTTTTIKGRLDSTPSREFAVRFFSNPAADEGKRFIGQIKVATDASGNTGTFTFKPTQAVRVGHTITATATDAPTNTDPGGNTSEFSAPREVTP